MPGASTFGSCSLSSSLTHNPVAASSAARVAVVDAAWIASPPASTDLCMMTWTWPQTHVHNKQPAPGVKGMDARLPRTCSLVPCNAVGFLRMEPATASCDGLVEIRFSFLGMVLRQEFAMHAWCQCCGSGITVLSASSTS